jgi:hypothetical protein
MYSAKVSSTKLNTKVFEFKNYFNCLNVQNDMSSNNSIHLETVSTENKSILTSTDFDFDINPNKLLIQLEELSKTAEDEELNYEVLCLPTLSKRYYTIQA